MYCTIPDDGDSMKVKIKGKIRIKDDKGNVIFEHDNNILFQTLTQVLAYLLTASLPNSTPSSGIVQYMMHYNHILMTYNLMYNLLEKSYRDHHLL